MIDLKTTKQEISGLFSGDEHQIKEKVKDLVILANQHNKEGTSGLKKGISYLRAMDCFFYMCFDDDIVKQYAFYVRGIEKEKGLNSVVRSVKMYLNHDNKETGISQKDLSCLRGCGMSLLKNDTTLGEFIEVLGKSRKVFFKAKENRQRNEGYLDRDQKDCIVGIIKQICTPPIDRYLSENGLSWCREERQVALFFYNILLNIKNKRHDKIPNEIKQKLLNVFECERISDIEIDHVYYEVAILRDYFFYLGKEEKTEFNRKLLRFCFSIGTINGNADDKDGIDELIEKYCSGDNEKSLSPKGRSKKPKDFVGEINVWKNLDKDSKTTKEQIIYFAGMIMNAKPDIMVVYRNKVTKQKCAIALECKFESDPSNYKDYQKPAKQTINQELLQEMIMTFMFGVKEGRSKFDKVLQEYCPSRGKDWYDIYQFCNYVLNQPNTVGLFNEESQYKVVNKGVREIDFKNKGGNNDKYCFPAENLISYGYCGKMRVSKEKN